MRFRHVSNNQGIVLLTTLMLTLIFFLIIIVLLYTVLQGTSQSGLFKRYETALQASHGGLEVFGKEVVSKTVGNGWATFYNSLPIAYQNLVAVRDAACFQEKLTKKTADWSIADCSNTITDLALYDVRFRLQGNAGQPNFVVDIKVVDSVIGNTDTSGIQLEGTAVVGINTGAITPQQIPYQYRLEVVGKRETNPDENARLSALYYY